MKRHFVSLGDVVRIELPFSEVCMSMQVAGKVMSVRFQEPNGYPNAQLLSDDGREYSAPITLGEAGFYFEDGRYYCYPEVALEHCPKCGAAVMRGDAFLDYGEGPEAGRTFYYCSDLCREAH